MNTKQRIIILEELQKLTSHPTADELYDIVRKRLANISLGTVYRNLNQLAKEGTILKLGIAGEQKRFDANTNKHYHFKCRSCSRIYDLPLFTIKHIEQIMASIKDHEVQGYNLEFYGICSFCTTKEKK